MKTRPPDFEIHGHTIKPGQRKRFEIPVAKLPTQTTASLPVEVIHGKTAGNVLWLSAAIHGDELNGIEVIRRVVDQISAKTLRGTIVAVPIVNVFGFLQHTRYLPDRRDLNRSFPGSKRGSLAGRLARLFMDEIVSPATHGIDLHTGSLGRTNLPQIRADLDNAETRRCARAFGAPLTLHAKERSGSLRAAASQKGRPVLLFEGGSVHRFEEEVIRAGTRGVLGVMAAIDMIAQPLEEPGDSEIYRRSKWARARKSGLFRSSVQLGDRVEKGQKLGLVADVFGREGVHVKASATGMVIGLALRPLVNQGDALINIAFEPEPGQQLPAQEAGDRLELP